MYAEPFAFGLLLILTGAFRLGPLGGKPPTISRFPVILLISFLVTAFLLVRAAQYLQDGNIPGVIISLIGALGGLTAFISTIRKVIGRNGTSAIR